MALSRHMRRKIVRCINLKMLEFDRYSNNIKLIEIKIEKIKWNWARRTDRYLVFHDAINYDFNCPIFFFKYQCKAIQEYLSTKFKCPIEIKPMKIFDYRKSRKEINEEKEKILR